MKRFHVWALILVGLVLALDVSSTGAAQQAYRCGRDVSSGGLVCQRIVSVDRSGQSGTYNDSSSGKMCKWKCSSDQGIETCKASGNECDKKLPPHWR